MVSGRLRSVLGQVTYTEDMRLDNDTVFQGCSEYWLYKFKELRYSVQNTTTWVFGANRKSCANGNNGDIWDSADYYRWILAVPLSQVYELKFIQKYRFLSERKRQQNRMLRWVWRRKCRRASSLPNSWTAQKLEKERFVRLRAKSCQLDRQAFKVVSYYCTYSNIQSLQQNARLMKVSLQVQKRHSFQPTDLWLTTTSSTNKFSVFTVNWHF